MWPAAPGGLVWLACALPWLGPLCWLYFAVTGLALGDLLRQAREAARFLDNGDPEAARTVVAGAGQPRGRGTRRGGPFPGPGRIGSAKTPTTDSWPPVFFLILGGPALLWAYKAVSTADSMWGYRTARHARLGWFGARADDVLAFVPARLTAGAMWLCGGYSWDTPGRFVGKNYP